MGADLYNDLVDGSRAVEAAARTSGGGHDSDGLARVIVRAGGGLSQPLTYLVKGGEGQYSWMEPEDVLDLARRAVDYDDRHGDSKAGASVDALIGSLPPGGRASDIGRYWLSVRIHGAEANHRRALTPSGKAVYSVGPKDWQRESWDWLNHISRHLDNYLRERRKDRLAFVTFNYDRSVEFYLAKYFEDRMGLLLDDAYRVAMDRYCPVAHVHGMVEGRYSGGGPPPAYGGMPDSDYQGGDLYLIGEDADTFREKSGVPDLMAEADRVVFLGFGYARGNLERIKPRVPKVGQVVQGTAYKADSAEVERIEREVESAFGGTIDLFDPNVDCNKALDRVWRS